MDPFDRLQTRLGDALACSHAGSTTPHVMVALPSYSISESLLSHYRDRIPALEHRYLAALLVLSRIESCEMVYVSSVAPDEATVDYYTSLLPPGVRDSVRARFHAFPVPGSTDRSVATRLAERPDLIEEIRERIGGRPAYIEPWNVTKHEVDVALQLDVPINGTSPALWDIAFKSAGRRIFAEAGVPVPVGQEDVRSADGVIQAVHHIRRKCPDVQAVVVKHDDSGAGDGNAVLAVRDGRGPASDVMVRARLGALPPWYLADIPKGCVVEELVVGEDFASPSVQLDIEPGGILRVLSTHEQVLGGDSAQVYTGCRFPAEPEYAAEIATHARAVGDVLAARGALGRLSVDFVACRTSDSEWRVGAIEVNLRKGGTTHPYAALRNLVPGRYDPDAATWIAEDGTPRSYCATDNLVDPAWTGLPPQVVIDAIRAAGFEFDHATGTGIVLHMLSCLAIDGRFGLTAIGTDAAHAADLYERAVDEIVAAAVGSSAGG